MIRLSPPQHGRIEFAPLLEVWVGGGEYNVSYALSRLGLRTGWVGGLNSSPMGAIIRNHARAVGMSTEYVVERKYDGVGKKSVSNATCGALARCLGPNRAVRETNGVSSNSSQNGRYPDESAGRWGKGCRREDES